MDQWIARKFLEHDRKLEAVSRGGIGIGNSSVTGGTLEIEGDHEIRLADGGINYIAGPPPPKPSAPTLQAGVGSVFVTWDGQWAEENDEDETELDTEAPLDFDRIEVHCSTDPEEADWGEDTLQGEIKAKAGGTVMVRGGDVEDEVFVCLIGLSKTGEHGEVSDRASIIIEGIDIAAITSELDAANLDLTNLDGDMFAANAEIDAAKIALKNVDLAVVSTEDGTLADALSDARDLSAELANQAKADAIADAAGKDSALKTQIDGTIAQARTDLEAGISSAESRAKAEAKTLSDSAREDAKSAASTDATTKMTNALNQAKLDATTKSDTAKADAISAAHTDAVSLSDAAKAAAISSAATDATTKADKAKADAITAAQTKATDLANAAKSDAINFASTRVFGPTQIGDKAITTAKLAAGAVTANEIKAGAIGAVAIAADAVTADKVQAGSIGTVALAADAITAEKIATDAVDARTIKANSIGAVAIAADSIEGRHVKADAITANKIGANAIGARAIAADAVEAGKIAANAITSREILANAITAEKIVGLAVTADKLAANSVSATKIAANAVVAGKIAANAVTAGTIAALAVTADKLAANAITADKLAANAVTAGKIQAGAINGMKIVGPDIFTSETGNRVHLGGVGIELYGPNDKRTFFAETATGNVSMTGSFYSNDATLPRVEIDNDDWANIGIVSPDGSMHYTNGAGIRIGSTATAGFSIYHGAYYSKTDASVIEGQAGLVEGPLGRTYLALMGEGEAVLAGTDATGAETARFTAAGLDGHASMTARVNGKTVANVHANKVGAAQINGMWSNGKNAGVVNAWNDGTTQMVSQDSDGNPRSIVRTTSAGSVEIQASKDVKIDAPAVLGLPMASGSDSTGTMVANTPKAVTVKFPTGRFKSPPIVMVTPATTVPGKTVTGWSVSSVTDTDCKVYITRTNTTSTAFYWFAVERDY